MLIEYFVIGLLFIIFIVFLLYNRAASKYEKILEEYQQLASSKQSLSTKYGQMTEQFMPFTSVYPYDKNGFRFVGSPVDGIQFNDDDIVFVEFKTSKSQLSEKQKNIRHLVDEKKVRFEEFRI